MADIKSIGGNPIVVGMDGLDEEVLDLLDLKADTDGYYQQLTAGAADNLTGRGDATAGAYLYRTTAGTASVSDEGVATVKSIHGRTVRWNQLAPAPGSELWTRTNVVASVSEGVITLVPTSATVTYRRMRGVFGAITASHKYLIAGTVDSTGLVEHTCSLGIYDNNGQGSTRGGITVQGGTAKARYAQIVTPSSGSDLTFCVAIAATSTSTESVTLENVMCIDLTAMFGAGSEPATVAEFEALYPLPYYPYDAGSLLPVRMTGVETNGFNQ